MWADGSLVLSESVIDEVSWGRGCGRLRIYDNDVHRDSCIGSTYTAKYICEIENYNQADQKKSTETTQVFLQSPLNTTFILPHIRCPSGHLTLDFLACDTFSSCWGNHIYSNDDSLNAFDVVSGEPVREFCPAPLTRLPPLFACRTVDIGVAYSLVCDGREDCVDRSDEDFCYYQPCTDHFLTDCDNLAQCVLHSAICDRKEDCHDGSDNVMCGDTLRNNGFCFPIFMICNGVRDCPGYQDELDCESYMCPGYYRCRGSRVCLHQQHMCDGMYQCPQKDDELFCNLVCPENCTCHGLAYTCPMPFHADLYRKVRYLDARNSEMRPVDLSNNSLLIYLNLASCSLSRLRDLTFPNLHVLDVSYNNVQYISITDLSSSRHLKYLLLAGNPLTTDMVFNDASPFNHHMHLVFLDMSQTNLTLITSKLFSAFVNIEHLNVSHNSLVSIERGALQPLKRLQMLDIRHCPLVEFSRNIFGGQTNLQTVFANNYKVCCPATLPEGFNMHNCHAPLDAVSSCTELLRFDVYRIVLSIVALCSLLGNVSSFMIRAIWLKNALTSSFVVFIIHLCISDFFMGVYLAIIGVADRLYMKNYIWEETSWRQSIACNVAGFLSLLSSETSAIIICLVTLDRFLVIRFPFSSVRFDPTSANAACLITWFTGCILAAVPLVHRDWNFYSQTGICIPLPITQLDFAGHDYAFGVVIVFNFVLFLFIASGQASIYVSILANQMSASSSTRKSKDVTIARHLITIAVSDFLCWFPIGLLGLLASRGTAIPGVINVTMAIIVLPLNSALNPFLYNLNILLEKRRNVREKQLMKTLKEELDKGLCTYYLDK